MGRGRSKARETKVARDLKYSNSETDLERLAIELHEELNTKKNSKENDLYLNDDPSSY